MCVCLPPKKESIPFISPILIATHEGIVYYLTTYYYTTTTTTHSIVYYLSIYLSIVYYGQKHLLVEDFIKEESKA
jgi:hypothetical protein